MGYDFLKRKKGGKEFFSGPKFIKTQSGYRVIFFLVLNGKNGHLSGTVKFRHNWLEQISNIDSVTFINLVFQIVSTFWSLGDEIQD